MSDAILSATPQKNVFKNIAWSGLFLFFLFFFTLSKLPEAKITNLIQGNIQVALDPYGIYITDHGREFSVLKGFEFKLIQPTLEFSDQTKVDLDEITISPSLLALFKGELGAGLTLKQGPALIKASGSGRNGKVNASIHFEQADLGKLGILAYAASLKGSGLINGDAKIEGPLADLPSLMGSINLQLSKIHLDEQNLMGFQLPSLNISEGVIEIPLEKGKLNLKNVRLGKANSTTEDLQLSLTGDVQLNRFLNASTLNLRTVFVLSEKAKSSLSILDSIISSAKQTDGKYAYKLTGSIGAPYPLPDPK